MGGSFENFINLYEVRDKDPWKDFYKLILDRENGQITIISLTNELSALSEYLDFIILAKDQGPIKF